MRSHARRLWATNARNGGTFAVVDVRSSRRQDIDWRGPRCPATMITHRWAYLPLWRIGPHRTMLEWSGVFPDGWNSRTTYLFIDRLPERYTPMGAP